MFNALKYLRGRRIPYWTEGKNVSYGGINIRCPMGCRDHSNHGSFFPDGSYRCWICGRHDIEDVVMALERIPYHDACRTVLDYDDGLAWRPPPGHKDKARGLDGRLDWPPGVMPLQDIHKRYLASRGFDPGHLEAKYKLKGTGPAGPYAWRIIAPFILDGQMVSYQGRSIDPRAQVKYKACRPEDELISHKKILYNLDNAGETAIIVEGVFDVWRLGDGAVAAVGTTVTRAQVMVAAERFRKAYILFDAEPAAQRRARKMAAALSVLGVEALVAELGTGDPADLDQGEADDIKKKLLG